MPRLSEDGEQLQADDQVEDAMRGAEAAMRLEKPVGQHAVLGHAVEHAVGADDGRIDRPGQDQEADDDHEGVQQQPGQRRADHVHRQAADEVVGVVLHADFVGDQQHGQEGDAGRQHARCRRRR